MRARGLSTDNPEGLSLCRVTLLLMNYNYFIYFLMCYEQYILTDIYIHNSYVDMDVDSYEKISYVPNQLPVSAYRYYQQESKNEP